MSRRTKNRLWWFVLATVIMVPNCVGPRQSGELPVAEPIVVRGNQPSPPPSTPPEQNGEERLAVPDDFTPPLIPVISPTIETEPEDSAVVEPVILDSVPVTVGDGVSDGIPLVTMDPFSQDLMQPLFALRVQQLEPVTISGFSRDTSILVPFGLFTDLTEVFIGEVEIERSFRGRGGRGRIQSFVVDTDSGFVRVGDEEFSIDSTQALWSNDELYLRLDVLERVLDIRAQMNWSSLELRISDAEHLPAVARFERALRRRFFEDIGTIEGAERLPALSPPVDGAVLDWSVTSLTSDPVQTSILQFGAGGLVAGGSLDLQFSRVNRTDLNTFDWSWIRAWSGNKAVRQLRFGEIASTGRARNPIRGGSVTNAPFIRPVAFADEILAGEFPEGWEVEVYRGNQLIAFTVVDSTGRFGINLPVRYGQNPVTLIGYGPRGEVVVRERTFEIPFLRLPGGTFEYGVSAGECQTVHCSFGQNVDFRYGVSDILTLQAGSEFFRRSGQADLWAPYALASMALTRSFSLTGEAVYNGLTRVRGDFAPSPNLRLSLTQSWFDQDDPTPLTGSVFETQRTQFVGFYRPTLLKDRVFFEARGTRSTGITRTQDLGSVSSTIRFAGSRLTGGLFYDRITDVNFTNERVGLEASFNSILRGPLPVLRSVFLTANARFDQQDGVSRIGVGAGRQILRPLRIDVRTQWDVLMGTTFNLELTSIFRQVRASSRNQYLRGSVYGSQQIEGSLLWNRPGGTAEFSNGRAMGRAGVTGVVFLDENLNGIRDDGEETIPDVELRIGSQIVKADSLGHFSQWDLIPFEPALVEIDRMSIDNPLWVPQYGPAYFTPTPNSYQLLELPVLEGGEVNGRVIFEDSRPIAGATVLLVHQETSDTTRVLTFSDGTFYSFGLRPGNYVADLAQSVLNRLNGVVAEMSFAIKPREGLLFADDIVLMFVRDDR